MSTDGILEYQGTKRVLFRGDTSNIVFDTRTTSLGIGVTGSNNPSSNLYITGNAYVSSNLAIGGVMTMGVVNVAARHNLQAVTDMGNVTTHTVEFTNPTTSIVASGNVEVGGSITGRGRIVTKTHTITHGESSSGEVDTYTLAANENRIVLNNAQGTTNQSRTYFANFNSGVPTEIGTIIYLEINSSRTNSDSVGKGHQSEIQFNGTKVLSTGYIYINPSESYSKTLKRVIILTSNGWEDIAATATGDNGNVGVGKTDPNDTLDVNGTIRITGKSPDYLRIRLANTFSVGEATGDNVPSTAARPLMPNGSAIIEYTGGQSTVDNEGSYIWLNGDTMGIMNTGDNETLHWYDSDDYPTATGELHWKIETDGTIGSSSDLRLKNNIRYFDDEYDTSNSMLKYSQIKFCKYNWKKELKDPSGVKEDFYGVIAQEIEPLFPEMIETDEAGLKMIKQGRLQYISYHMIASLIQKNAALEARISALENA